MTHTKALQVVNSLMPSIRKGTPAGEALLKYAKDESLPPAQLEKLAQVLNTCRTVVFMDKSAARGDTFEIVDVPDLMTDYTKHKMPAKSAGSPGWNEKRASFSGPDMLSLPLEKSAFANAVIEVGSSITGPGAGQDILQSRQSFIAKKASEEELRFSLQVADDMEDEATFRINTLTQKLASEFRGCDDPLIFAKVEHDMLSIFEGDEGIKQACNVVAKYMQFGPSAKPVVRAAESEHQFKLARDRFNAGPEFQKLAEDLQLVANARAYKEQVKAAAGATVYDTRNGGFTDAPFRGAVNNGHPKGGRSNEGGQNSSPKGEAAPARSNEGEPQAPQAEAGEGRSNEGNSNRELLELITGGNVGGGGGPQPGAGKDVWDPFHQGANTFLDDRRKDMFEMLNSMGPSKNTRQESQDTAHEEVRQTTNIERLLHTDPVISRADPAVVVSLFNSMRQHSPTIANDINALRLSLREAVQYEGLTPDALKSMVGVNFDTNRSKAISSDAKQQRYAIPRS